MLKSIDFIGEIHTDERLDERVYNILSYLKPDAVAVELDEVRLERRYCSKDLDEFLSWPGVIPETVAWWKRVRGGSYCAAKRYADEHSIPLHLIDTIGHIYEYELVSKEERAKFLSKGIAEIRVGTQFMYENKERISFNKDKHDILLNREITMEKNLRALDGHVVSCNGLAHVYRSLNNPLPAILFERFADLDADRWVATEGDYLQVSRGG